MHREPNCLYEIAIDSLQLNFIGAAPIDFTETLENGRSSYILFELLVARLAGLTTDGQGAGSDLADEAGVGYEVKSYRDPELYPQPRYDWFHTAASRYFGSNSSTREYKKYLEVDDRAAMLAMCKTAGFDHNEFYIYTNTGGYKPEIPFRYMIIPSEEVLRRLLPSDPRKVSRVALLEMCSGRTKRITL